LVIKRLFQTVDQQHLGGRDSKIWEWRCVDDGSEYGCFSSHSPLLQKWRTATALLL
jgi:hypothetical protein